MNISANKLHQYFSKDALFLLDYMEWDSYDLLKNPDRIILSSIEGNEAEIPWFGNRIEVQEIPPHAYFCNVYHLSGGFASLVDYSGHFANINCLYGYDWSWCGPGLVFRGLKSILTDAVARLRAGLHGRPSVHAAHRALCR